MNKKRLLIFSVLVIVIMSGIYLGYEKYEIKQTDEKYANNPVMLYQTVGIQGCEFDYRYKGERSGAVQLEGEDLVRAITFLRERFGHAFKEDIDTVLYINAPEATEQNRGQPALLPLIKRGGKYCALGVFGSYSMQPFLDFEKKYQKQIE